MKTITYPHTPNMGWSLFVRFRRWYNQHEGWINFAFWTCFGLALVVFYHG